MNTFQKFAVFTLRVAGVAIAVVGVVGPLTVVILSAFGIASPPYGSDRYVGSLIFVIEGVVLMITAEPLGRRLGHGLD